MHGGRTRNTRDASRTHAQNTIESFTTRRQEGDGGGSQTGAGAPRKHDSGARRTAHNATPIVEMRCAHTADRREVLKWRHVPMRDRESSEGFGGFHASDREGGGGLLGRRRPVVAAPMSLITPLRHVGPSVRLWHVATSGGWARAPAARCYVLHAPFALRDLAEAVGRLPVIGSPVASSRRIFSYTHSTCRAERTFLG